MKFTSVAAFTAAVALSGASISYAAPLNGGDNSIQMRAQETISEFLSRSVDDSDAMLERDLIDAALLEYTTRSFEDGGELFVRDGPLSDELFERSEDLDARDEGIEFSYWARSDEDGENLFAREEDLVWSRDFDEAAELVARSKIGNFFKKVFGGIKKVFLG